MYKTLQPTLTLPVFTCTHVHADVINNVMYTVYVAQFKESSVVRSEELTHWFSFYIYALCPWSLLTYSKMKYENIWINKNMYIDK